MRGMNVLFNRRLSQRERWHAIGKAALNMAYKRWTYSGSADPGPL
jgi:hypothetical protein